VERLVKYRLVAAPIRDDFDDKEVDGFEVDVITFADRWGGGIIALASKGEVRRRDDKDCDEGNV
jgi:hypothetical protein